MLVSKRAHDTFYSVSFFLYSYFSYRGLRFIQILLQSLADGEKDETNPNLIRVNITRAYEETLKRYHGWIVQQIFKVG